MLLQSVKTCPAHACTCLSLSVKSGLLHKNEVIFLAVDSLPICTISHPSTCIAGTPVIPLSKLSFTTMQRPASCKWHIVISEQPSSTLHIIQLHLLQHPTAMETWQKTAKLLCPEPLLDSKPIPCDIKKGFRTSVCRWNFRLKPSLVLSSKLYPEMQMLL